MRHVLIPRGACVQTCAMPELTQPLAQHPACVSHHWRGRGHGSRKIEKVSLYFIGQNGRNECTSVLTVDSCFLEFRLWVIVSYEFLSIDTTWL